MYCPGTYSPAAMSSKSCGGGGGGGGAALQKGVEAVSFTQGLSWAVVLEADGALLACSWWLRSRSEGMDTSSHYHKGLRKPPKTEPPNYRLFFACNTSTRPEHLGLRATVTSNSPPASRNRSGLRSYPRASQLRPFPPHLYKHWPGDTGEEPICWPE